MYKINKPIAKLLILFLSIMFLINLVFLLKHYFSVYVV